MIFLEYHGVRDLSGRNKIATYGAPKKQNPTAYCLDTETKAEAIAIGSEIASNQRSEMVIHGRNGQMQDKNSYGNDTFPPKG